ncbi:hypothetical protein TIFTF001_041505 [Ficus carica]|uniref:Uncharacterized protein n=1 Tax=Ficus carica TaxID=3494 RepID=A0AA88CT92_FICCA|nr:hypothetical protein TIFTF001_041505 [Ficus carica]
MHVNEKSMGGLANAFNPLWETLRKKLKKLPPKALLFEEKLERFKEIQGVEPLEGLFRTPISPPLFIESLFDEEAFIVEFALDTMSVALPSAKDLLAKKEVEKAAKAAADAATSTAPESSLLQNLWLCPCNPLLRNGKQMGNLRERFWQKGRRLQRLLPHKQTSNWRSLSSRWSGRILNLVDDLLWDGLKSNLRALGLMYRTIDTVLEKRNQIKELDLPALTEFSEIARNELGSIVRDYLLSDMNLADETTKPDTKRGFKPQDLQDASLFEP